MLSVQTAYTKAHPTKPNAFVCFDCCTVLGIDPFAKTKKPAAKRAPVKGKKKEESRKVVSYEQRKGAINLAEMCIKVSVSRFLVESFQKLTPLEDDWQVYRKCGSAGQYWKHEYGQGVPDYFQGTTSVSPLASPIGVELTCPAGLRRRRRYSTLLIGRIWQCTTAQVSG